MGTVWKPDTTIRPGNAPGAWEIDTGGYSASLAGFRAGRPTMVVRNPGGARVSWQADRLAWRMTDGTLRPISLPVAAVESLPEPNCLVVPGGMGEGVDDIWRVEGGRLKHEWRLPVLTVPDGAAQLLVMGRLFTYECQPVSPNGRTAGGIGLFAPAEPEAVFMIDRGNAVDESGNQTHTLYEWETVGKRTTMTTVIDAEWVRSADGRITIDPTVSTSTSSTATAWSNQRKLARFSNGVLFAGPIYDGSNARCYYSADNGATWQTPSTGATIDTLPNGSVFIDDQDFIHIAARWSYTGNNAIHYYRGTPNANRTGYTWSAALTLVVGSSADVPDIVAHAEGTGWKAHVVRSWTDGSSQQAVYHRINIASDGTITADGAAMGFTTAGGGTHVYPSINLDGNKTLYVVWSFSSAGVNKGVRFRRATYSSGAWTWQTEEAVTESAYVLSGFLSSVVDTSGQVYVAVKQAESPNYLLVYRRAAAGGWTNISPSNLPDTMPTLAVDGTAIFLFSINSGALLYRKYTGTWAAAVTVESSTSPAWVTARRDSSGSAIDVLYTTGSASPYTVKNYRLSLNSAPLQPSNLNRANFDATTTVQFTWQHEDSPGDGQSQYQLQIVPNGGSTPTVDTGWVQSATSAHTLTGGTLTNGGSWQWRVRTKDQAGAESPWSAYATFQTGAGPLPTVLFPISGTVVNGDSLTMEWSIADQGQYRARRYPESGSTPASDSGWVSDGIARRRTFTGLANNTTGRVSIQVRSSLGIEGPEVFQAGTFTVSYTPPAAPPLTVIPNAEYGHMELYLSGQGGDVQSNDIYRRPSNNSWANSTPDNPYRLAPGISPWVRIATGVAPNGTFRDYTAASGVLYEYQALAVATNGTTADSNVVSAIITLTGVWVHAVADPQGTAMMMTIDPERSEDWQGAFTPQIMAGRALPVVDVGDTDDQRFRYGLLFTRDMAAHYRLLWLSLIHI